MQTRPRKPADSGARFEQEGNADNGRAYNCRVLVISTMLWTQWNAQVELTLLAVLVLAGLGFYDDYAKIVQQSGGGTPPRVKLVAQIALALFVGFILEIAGDERDAFPEAETVILSNLVRSDAAVLQISDSRRRRRSGF